MKKLIAILLSIIVAIIPFCANTVNATTDNTENIISEETYTLDDSVKIDNTTISVKGEFEEEGKLSVQKIEGKKLSEDNIAHIVSYDIKVINEEGEEMQPEGKVDVSFTFDNINSNLEPKVYHEEELLKAEVKDNTVTVQSNGFSVYTVKFTYEDKQYVLEGDSYVKLDDVLSKVGLTGEVTEWEISNSTLFNVVKGDGNGPIKEEIKIYGNEAHTYNTFPNEGDILYIVSLQPFKTEEWIDVTIDGVKHHIKVTDDYISYSNTSGLYNNSSTPSVIQGDNEDNFTKHMPIATIFIDEDIINMSESSRNAAEIIHSTGYPGKWTMINPTSYPGIDDNFLSFYMGSNNPLNHTSTNNDTFFQGDIISYKYNNGAAVIHPYSGKMTRYDVIITYSDLHITLQNNLTEYEYGQMIGNESPNQQRFLGLFQGNLIGLGQAYRDATGNLTAPKSVGKGQLTSNGRYGIQVNVNIKVVDKETGEPIEGTFYYPMVDLDVNRSSSPSNKFGALYNASEYNNYSEQVVINKSSLVDGKIYIPGGDFDENKTIDGTKDNRNMPYLNFIKEDTDTITVLPLTTYKDAGAYKVNNSTNDLRDNDFYTGFAALVNNTAGGLNLTYRASSPDATKGGINTYFLSGTSHINHLLVSSTGEGGTISTTRYGNHSGDLSDNSELFETTEGIKTPLTVATGQTVVYTMIPEDDYVLKSVTVNRSNTDISEEGTVDITPTEITLNNGKKAYIFAFEDINNDGSIHVEWEKVKKLTLTKNTVNNESGDFNFKIKIFKNPEEEVVTDATIDDNYTIHNDDLTDYRIDMSNYTYRWYNQNVNNFRAKRTGNPLNSGWAKTIGFASAMGKVTTETTANGEALLRLNQVVTASDGSKKDLVIKVNSVTINPNGNTYSSDFSEIFTGELNGYPAFVAGKTTDEDVQYTGVSDGDYTSSGNVSVYVTDIGGTTPLSGTLPFVFSNIYQNESVSVAGDVVNGALQAVIDSNSNITLNTTGNKDMIYLVGNANQHSLQITSGANGKIEATTNGIWRRNGSVSEEGKILSEGIWGVPNHKSVRLKLTPEEGYEIDTVTVNGNNTSAIPWNGFYFLDLPYITEDTVVNVTWKTGNTPHIDTTPPTSYYNLSTGEKVTTEYINDITLSNSQSLEWLVPYGWEYEIVEDGKEGWYNISKTNESGVMTSDQNSTWKNAPYTDITVYKQWVDGETHTSSDILSSLSLFQNNINITSQYSENITVTDKGDGKWEYKVSDLPKYDNSENAYTYTVKETTVPEGYKVIYDNGNAANNEETITNIKTFDIEVDKTVTGLKGDKNKEFEFTVKVWNEQQDDTQYEYVHFIDAGGADSDQNPDWNLTSNVAFTYQGKTFEENKMYTMYREYGGDRRWYGFNNEYRGAADRPALYYENRIEGPYDDALISFFEALIATPREEFDYMPPNDTGEKVIIQGEEYPLFAAGYDSSGSEHAYNVYYGEPAIQKTYIDLSSQGGIDNGDDTYTFKLKDGQNFKIEDIPYGYKYEIIENDYSSELYTTFVDGDNTRTASGTVTENVTHEYVNDKDFADLSFSKTVLGNMADKTKEFEFTVSFTNSNTPVDLASIPEGFTKTATGIYKINLINNTTVSIENIPAGYSYKITETSYPEYETKIDGNKGREIEGVMDEDKTHEFENINNAAVPTKVAENNSFMWLIIGLSVIGAWFVGIRIIKRR